MLLRDLLTAHRDELVVRTRAKLAARALTEVVARDFPDSLGALLDDVMDAVCGDSAGSSAPTARPPEDRGATRRGRFLQAAGLTVAQVVHAYGDVARTLCEMAAERGTPLNVDDSRALARWLDHAVAEAVTEFARQRDLALDGAAAERMGHLAHELRNLVGTASLAFEAMKDGQVGAGGATAGILGRSLGRLRGMVDRSLAAVRLRSGQVRHERIRVAELMEDIEVAAALDARAHGLAFAVAPTDPALDIVADPQILSAAIVNLLQNAFKFTPLGGHVSLAAQAFPPGRVRITVEDECGGLPPGGVEALFHPFEQRHADRSGLGLGLAIARDGVQCCGGRMQVEDTPGRGCTFIVDLPLGASPAMDGAEAPAPAAPPEGRTA